MAAGEREQGQAPTGGGLLARFRYEYGAQPLHLVAVASGLLLSGYGLLRITEIPSPGRILIWLLAAALLHDLIALPFYSLLLRIAHGAAGKAISTRAAMLPALNAVRIPAALSLLLLLVYFPLIFRIAPEQYMATTGQSLDPYLSRWLLISAALFLISGIVYALHLRRGTTVVEPGSPARLDPGPPPPLPLVWRIGARVTLVASALLILFVAAALVVGLLDSGLGF